MADHTITVQIEISEQAITDAVQKYIDKSFEKPAYLSSESIAYNQIKQQVDAYIKEMDFRPYIKESIYEVARKVTAELLAGEMGKHIRDIIYKEIKSGISVKGA